MADMSLSPALVDGGLLVFVAVLGPVVYGAGATEAAAMVAAVAQVHLGQVTVREVPRHGC